MGEQNGGSKDAFLMKITSDGELSWIQQLGVTTQVEGLSGANQAEDACNGIAVDSLGSVYCAGYTAGTLGEANGGNWDAFVAKVDQVQAE
jgi:hypothetical protein